MHMPDLGLQIIYGRLAWGIVLAAMVMTLWPRRYALSPRAIGVLLLGMLALQALPDAASPAFSLGLAFQVPSGMLVGLCLAKLYLGGAGAGSARDAVMSTNLAIVIATSGTVLYLDAFGLISVGFYYWGFGPYAAPVIALLLAIASSVAIYRDKARVQAVALLLALMSFAVLRLPTGNLFDALLDPLMWGWALVSLAAQALRRAPKAIPA